MTVNAFIEVPNQDPLRAVQDLLVRLLAQEEVQAMLVPRPLPMAPKVMPALVTDPDDLSTADPLAPAFPLNAAKLVAQLTRRPRGGKLAVVLRPCEIRAFVELVKLKQGATEELIIIAADCLGALDNSAYRRFAGEDISASTRAFLKQMLADPASAAEGFELAPACRACEHPIPAGADIQIGLWGVDTGRQLLVSAASPAGQAALQRLALSPAEAPVDRTNAIKTLVAARRTFRDEMFERTQAATAGLEKLAAYLADCVNCYNCRVACPVCYCRECVFVTDVFDHEPVQYLRWAQRKGAIKLPTDTLFYHLTRLAHMSTACVGCGQCSNACPNQIPVMELFRLVAHRVQQSFGYEAGRSIEERPPLAEFEAEEFQEVVGLQ